MSNLTFDNRETLEKFIREVQAQGFGWERLYETSEPRSCNVWIDGWPFPFHSNRQKSLFDLGVGPNSQVCLSSADHADGGVYPTCKIIFVGKFDHTVDRIDGREQSNFRPCWNRILDGDPSHPLGYPDWKHWKKRELFHSYVDISNLKCTIHVVQGQEIYTIATDWEFQDVRKTSISEIWESMGSGFENHQLHESLVIFNLSGPISHV